MLEYTMQSPLESEKIQPDIVKRECKRSGDNRYADDEYYNVTSISIQLTGRIGIPFSAR